MGNGIGGVILVFVSGIYGTYTYIHMAIHLFIKIASGLGLKGDAARSWRGEREIQLFSLVPNLLASP